jgi:mannose-1-phosphate guanylyltransferase
MKAMILAAGLGTRLRPYSLLRPKPLFPVLGRPLLLHHLEMLRGAGFGPMVVNAHHLQEQISRCLAGEDGVTVQQEEQIMGTGGGLRLAAARLGREPVLVTNGDIYHTIDLAKVYAEHCTTGAAATLVLHDCPRFNKVTASEDGRILGFGGSQNTLEQGRLLAFTGIHVLDPAALHSIPPGVFADIIDYYRALIRRGREVRALIVRDHFWTDIGTPEDYLALHAHLLGKREPAGRFLVDEQAELGRGLRLQDWAVIGRGARIGEGVSLSRVVVWDGAEIAAGRQLADTVVT